MRDRIKAMLDAKNQRIDELRAKNEAAETVEELRSIEAETATLIEERNELQEMYDNFDAPAQTEKRNNMEVVKTMENTVNTVEINTAEERAKTFAASHKMVIDNAEARAAVLVSGGTVAQPVGVSGINGLPQGGSIVDMVKVVDASNMGGGYKIAYQITDSAAAAHTEGGDIGESEPTFGLLTVTAADKALVSYISNKVRKQSPLTYEQKVRESAMAALRDAASGMIVAALEASTITETVSVKALDATFLRKIALTYGGDETIGGSAVLLLNKADLIALGDIRGTNEKKAVFEITPDTANPNTGIIKDGGLAVRYVINSKCKQFASAAASAKCMFYGNPQAIELAMFSDYEVATSEDYKFGQDMLTVRGSASMGAAMGTYKGFVAVAKGE